MKPIIALATPPINSPIHIIRLSGDEIYNIVNKICKPKLKKIGYQIQYTNLIDNHKIIDKVLINKFVSPKSYTGEDVIEINTHGSYFLSQKIIKLLISHGCQLAKPGEFTMRAVLNNKMNLLQAQAVDNLIKSRNDYAVESANHGLDNETSKKLRKYKKILFDLISKLEITIDYPDMDDSIDKKKIIQQINWLINEFKIIIETSKRVNIFNEGINVVIVGDVNVGKSSLLNAIAKQERAIVTNTPGTTRDVIETKVNIDKLTFNFYDTAGIRKTKNRIEILGINESKKIMKKADLILHVIDGSKKMSDNTKQIMKLIANKNYLNVINKTDLKCVTQVNGVKISATRHNIKALLDKLLETFKKDNLLNNESLILQSKLWIERFEYCMNTLLKANKILRANNSVDMIIADLHMVLDNLLVLLNEKKDFNFINEMFKNFCIGK